MSPQEATEAFMGLDHVKFDGAWFNRGFDESVAEPLMRSVGVGVDYNLAKRSSGRHLAEEDQPAETLLSL